jgi:RNA polymerase sigma-70 factor (ECF subfamily)
MPDATDQFVQLLTSSQGALRGYILSLLPDATQADEVVQETNLALWHMRDQFEPGTSFMAWASKVAYFRVLSHRRKLQRDRLIFDDRLLDYLAERQSERFDEGESRRHALRRCLARLSDAHRELLRQRYGPSASVDALAKQLGQSAAAVSQRLYRIRRILSECIQRTLAAEASS